MNVTTRPNQVIEYGYDDTEGYSFGGFVNETPKPTHVEPHDRVDVSSFPKRQLPPAAFAPSIESGEGYKWGGFVSDLI